MVTVYLVKPALLTAQVKALGVSRRHVLIGNEAEHHGVPSFSAVHEQLLEMMIASLGCARFLCKAGE
jgi:hypothetical protein